MVNKNQLLKFLWKLHSNKKYFLLTRVYILYFFVFFVLFLLINTRLLYVYSYIKRKCKYINFKQKTFVLIDEDAYLSSEWEIFSDFISNFQRLTLNLLKLWSHLRILTIVAFRKERKLFSCVFVSTVQNYPIFISSEVWNLQNIYLVKTISFSFYDVFSSSPNTRALLSSANLDHRQLLEFLKQINLLHYI